MKEPSLFEEEEQERSLLDQLLEDSRLYRNTEDYRELLAFIARLRNFAPFNAMLLNIQKPGITYVASAADWQTRFGRKLNVGARPLLILWPFGPVRLVYDVQDTDGEPLPKDAEMFPAHGPIDKYRIGEFAIILTRNGIEWCVIDAGDGKAGAISLLCSETKDTPGAYRLTINCNHPPPTQFVTLAHELGHLFLGHLGANKKLRVPFRMGLSHEQEELEAESIAYLIAKRNGVEARSHTYLSALLEKDGEMPKLDLYQIMRAAGQVETFLGLKTSLSG